MRNPGEYNQLMNGVPMPNTYAVKMVVASNGTVWSNNYANQWYTYNGSTWTPQTSGPSTYVPSRFGATIVPAYGGSVTDASGNVWSYGGLNADGVDYNILLNGAATSAHGTQISIDNTGTMWQANAQGNWYTFNGTQWTQGGAPNLFAPVIGSYVTPAAAGELRELQLVDTGAWGVPGSGANAVPVVANGHVYVATTNALTIWGIAGAPTLATGVTPGTPQSQTISFAAIPAQSIGVKLTLAATASSGLPVTYSSSTAGICTVSGGTVSTLNAGLCTIVAAQAGNANYLAAPPVSQSFTVSASATPSFSIAVNSPSLSLMPGTGGSVVVSATPVKGFNGAVTYSASGVPAGVDIGFLPTGGVNQNYFVVYVLPGTAAGTSAITLKGTSGTTSATTTVSLVIP